MPKGIDKINIVATADQDYKTVIKVEATIDVPVTIHTSVLQPYLYQLSPIVTGLFMQAVAEKERESENQ